MTLKPIAAIFLSVVLLWCLSAVPNPHFSLPDRDHGLIHSLALQDEKPVFSTKTQYAELAAATNEDRYDKVTFLGDVLLARHVEFLMNQHGSDFPYKHSSWLNNDTAAVFANFESAISQEHQMTEPYMMRFSTNPVHVSALREAGITHVSLANNHSMDFGVTGFYTALEKLLNEDIAAIGCDRSVECERISYVDVSGRTIAVVALYALEGGASALGRALLNEASAQSDFQLVYVHWGEEYALNHNATQERLAKKWIESGADLIIGHHPHVVQDIQLIDGVPVIYSLGNYIFDQYFSLEVKTGLAVTLSFDRDPRVELLPIDARVLGQPRLIEGDSKAAFLYELGERSHPDLSRHIARGEIPLKIGVASSSKTAMIQQ